MPPEQISSIATALGCDGVNDLLAQAWSLPVHIDKIILAPAIRKARKESNIPLEAAAKTADMPVDVYQVFEAGRREIPGAKIDALLKQVGFTSREALLEKFDPEYYHEFIKKPAPPQAPAPLSVEPDAKTWTDSLPQRPLSDSWRRAHCGT